MQLVDWVVKAGEYTPLVFSGRFLRLITCVGTVQIDVDYEAPETDRITSKLFTGIGVDLSHPVSHARFKAVAFTSPVDQVLQVLISEFPSTDSRLSGNVTVQSGSIITTSSALDVVKAGSAFQVVAWAAIPGSTDYPMVEIKNISATRNVVIEEIELFSGATGFINLGRFDTELVDLGVALRYYNNMVSGIPGPTGDIVARVRSNPTAVSMTTRMGIRYVNGTNIEANVFKPTKPILLVPGERFGAQGQVNAQFAATFKGYLD